MFLKQNLLNGNQQFNGILNINGYLQIASFAFVIGVGVEDTS